MKNSPIASKEKLTPTRNCVDLSLTTEEIGKLLSQSYDPCIAPKQEDYCRHKIEEYRNRIRANMHHEDQLNITPWGVWEEVKKGLYVLDSTLNNCFLDTELSSPHIHDDNSFVEIYERMEQDKDGGGIKLVESAICRGRHTFYAGENLALLREKYSNWDDPFIDVVVHTSLIDRTYSKASTNYKNIMIENFSNKLERILYRGLNERFVGKTNILHRTLSVAVDDHFRRGGVAGRNGSHMVSISLDQIVRSLDIEYTFRDHRLYVHKGTPTQRIFIDLRTLAILSSVDANNRKPSDTFWYYWSCLGTFGGFPIVPILPLGELEPSRPLSPQGSGSNRCPIFNMVQAMWAAGAADEFSIQLSLDHPDPTHRGAYFSFNMGGEGYDKILEIAKQVGIYQRSGQRMFNNYPKFPESVLKLQLNNPYDAIREENKSAIDVFNEILNPHNQ